MIAYTAGMYNMRMLSMRCQQPGLCNHICENSAAHCLGHNAPR